MGAPMAGAAAAGRAPGDGLQPHRRALRAAGGGRRPRGAHAARRRPQGADLVISIVTDSPDAEAGAAGAGGRRRGRRAGHAVHRHEHHRARGRPAASAQQLGGAGAGLPGRAGHRRRRGRPGGHPVHPGGRRRRRPGAGAARCWTVLGKRITHCGPVGAGQTVKACNQILCALNMVGIVEALHLAEANGIDLHTMLEALAPGGGRLLGAGEAGPAHRRRRLRPGLHGPPHPEGPAHRAGHGPAGAACPWRGPPSPRPTSPTTRPTARAPWAPRRCTRRSSAATPGASAGPLG